MTYRIRNITIAIALAVVAALLTAFYVKNYERDVRKDETNVPIYVAKVDIPAGTSGAQVARGGMMTMSEIVRRSIVPAQFRTRRSSPPRSPPSRSMPVSRCRRAVRHRRRRVASEPS